MHIAALFTELAVTAPAAFAWLAAQWQSFASWTGSALITSIWQGAVIICTLEIATRLMPRISATHRFALWAAGFVLSLALPLFGLMQFGTNSTQNLAPISGTALASPHALFQLDARWGVAIAALWALGSLIRAADLAVHSIRLWRLWNTAQPVEIGETLAAELKKVRGSRVALCTTNMLDRPSVIGFFAPRILIPHWLLPRLTAGELEQIVLHETEHLRRRDDWTNLIQKLCLVVFPLNPALAWIEHHLCSEREMACDEGVIRLTNAPRAYAACLANLAERHLEHRAEALSLGAWHRRPELVRRVHRILLHKRAMSKTAAGALLATLGSMLLAASVEMSRVPQLVAFVPRNNTQAMTPARQVQLDNVLARENAESKLHLPASYSAVPARAIVRDAASSTTAHTRRHTTPKPTAETAPSHEALATSAQQIAKSDLLGDRVIPAHPQQPQQWVVVTTWREFSSASRVPQTISDFEAESEPTAAPATTTGAETKTATSKATNIPAQTSTENHSTAPEHHLTVTQLILRVVPASPNSNIPQPPATMVRDGWLVIQL